MKKSKNIKKSTTKKKKDSIKDIDAKKGRIVFGEFKGQIQKQEITSPFLPPNLLADYEKVIPGFAKKVCDSTLQSIQHQVESEKKFIEMQNKKTLRGQIFGFIVAAISIVGAVICVFKGALAPASILAGGSAVPHIITQFITMKTKKKGIESESEEKE